MSSRRRKEREAFGNITNADDPISPMDSQFRNIFHPEEKEMDLDMPTGLLDPGISLNPIDLNFEQENNLSTRPRPMPPNEENIPFSMHQTFTTVDALKKCSNWMNKYSSHLQGKSEDSEPKRKKRRRKKDWDEDYPDSVCSASTGKKRGRKRKKSVRKKKGEGDCDEDHTNNVCLTSGGNKKKEKTIKFKEERLDLRCEWRDCDYSTPNLDTFVRHVSLHIPELEVKQTEDSEDVLVCLWQYCGFESADTKEIVRHVNFHSYHTKIKCIGSNMLARSKIPACTFDPDGRNLAPELPDMFACCWADCERVFNNSQMYFYHVDAHVQNNPRGKNVEGGISCLWRSCRSVFRSVYKLADHVRSHTQEKLVGCPTCGGLFASKTKFFDHCKRQVPLELLGYQCSHCSKYYPSERLLRDHMRHHVNHYKCTFCDMTCPTPSSLASHIRYRHIDSKPFKCNFCEYTGKTHYDLRHHLNTHCSDPLYQCDEEGCNYSCRSAYGLERHYRRIHRGDDEPLYCCHMCDRRFQRGALLTRHLFNDHSFRWPSGHCRFRYKHDEDGYFRLQTVRYESLEVTQEMMQSESGDNTEQVYTDKSYNLRRMNNGNEFIFSEDEDEDDPKVQESSGGRILISVEELDGCGNVVNTKLMEAVEVPSLPPGTVTVIHDGGEVAEEIIPN